MKEVSETQAEHSSSKAQSTFALALQIVDFLAKLVAVLGAIWVAFEYVDNQHSQRVQNTLEFVARYDSSALAEVRGRIASAVKSRENALGEIRKIYERGDISLEQSNELLLEEIKQMNFDQQSSRLEEDVVRLSEFYSGLQVCIENKICDRKTARDFFSANSSSFWWVFRPYFESERQARGKTFGMGLENFNQPIPNAGQTK